MAKQFRLVPLTLSTANAFVADHHRHHEPLDYQLFSIGAKATEDNRICGVAIIARPPNQSQNDGFTVDVARLATDGTTNACSFLYGAAAKAAWATGRLRIGTYIRDDEPGTSLQAAGWRLVRTCQPKSWASSGRQRADKTDVVARKRFELLHPDLLSTDEGRWFDRVIDMAEQAKLAGATDQSCPFTVDDWDKRRVWNEIFSVTDRVVA